MGLPVGPYTPTIARGSRLGTNRDRHPNGQPVCTASLEGYSGPWWACLIESRVRSCVCVSVRGARSASSVQCAQAPTPPPVCTLWSCTTGRPACGVHCVPDADSVCRAVCAMGHAGVAVGRRNFIYTVYFICTAARGVSLTTALP